MIKDSTKVIVAERAVTVALNIVAYAIVTATVAAMSGQALASPRQICGGTVKTSPVAIDALSNGHNVIVRNPRAEGTAR